MSYYSEDYGGEDYGGEDYGGEDYGGDSDDYDPDPDLSRRYTTVMTLSDAFINRNSNHISSDFPRIFFSDDI
jgi:hypothetical protein